MVCIEKRPHISYGRSSALYFRYLTCLLDRYHIRSGRGAVFFVGRAALSSCGAFILIVYNSWNKDEIPPNQAAQRGCSSQKCLI